ncbi:MAG: TRAP transporter substrate-binding protein [Cyclobacteriaceae bacterium]|nr:TRAP transporter substrate-binding protein [Cyclobacteriaceae bacterium]
MRYLAFISLVFVWSCQQQSQRRELVLAHGLDVNHSVHKAMEYMAREVEKSSSGQLIIKIYPNQQLGSERETLELLQIGSIDLTKTSAAVMENFAPAIQVLSLPYLFRSEDHAYRVFTSEVGKELLLSGESYFLRGLSYYDAGMRNFYTKDRPVNHPDDIRGLKVRVQQSITAMEMVKAMGGSATPIAWGELYTALQQGVVDAAENNLPSFYLSHHYEVCQFLSINQHTAVPDILLISTHTWKRLSDQEKKWVQQAADASYAYQVGLWKETESQALEAVKKAGVRINYPDKQSFIDITAPMRDELKQDPLIGPYIDKIEAMAMDANTDLTH